MTCRYILTVFIVMQCGIKCMGPHSLCLDSEWQNVEDTKIPIKHGTGEGKRCCGQAYGQMAGVWTLYIISFITIQEARDLTTKLRCLGSGEFLLLVDQMPIG